MAEPKISREEELEEETRHQEEVNWSKNDGDDDRNDPEDSPD